MTFRPYIEKLNLVVNKKPTGNASKQSFFFGKTIKGFCLLSTLLLLFTSCPNAFVQPEEPSPHPAEERVIRIRGTFSEDEQNLNGAYPEAFLSGDMTAGSNRLANPAPLTGNKEYSVKATATGQQELSGSVNPTANTFEINLTLGHIWTIEVELKTQEEGEDASTTKLKGSYTYGAALAESNINTSIPITLRPTTNGNGKIDLEISQNPDLYDYIEIIPDTIPEGGEWTGNTTVTDGVIDVDSIPSGVYAITLLFKKSNLIVYSCEQTINVFDNMTTNKWISDGNQHSPINDSNAFELTSVLINHYARTNLYVAYATVDNTAGNDSRGDGSSKKPFLTVNRALQAIKDLNNSANEYTIRILSDLNQNINMDSASVGTNTAARITIKGYDGNKTIEATSGSILTINTAISVTLDNLTFNLGNSTETSGGGIYIGSPADSQQDVQANVELYNCTIQNCSSGHSGGGIYVAQGSAATLTYCNIDANTTTSSEGGGGIYAGGSVTLNNCLVTRNSANNNGNGGGIYQSPTGSVTVNGGNISDNNATKGGAIYIESTDGSGNDITLKGALSIPAGEIRANSIYIADKKIIIGDDFSWTGSKALLYPSSFTNGTTVLAPSQDSSLQQGDIDCFTLENNNFSIGSNEAGNGILVLNRDVYVSSASTGEGTRDGSQAKPFASVNEALSAIGNLAQNNSADYVIHVNGDVNGSIFIDTTSLGAFTGSTLKICGSNKDSDKLNGCDCSYLLIIDREINLTLENLTIYNLNSNANAAIQIEKSGANVTIKNCDITGNKNTSTTNQGGGIYNKGSLTLSDCTIAGNAAKYYGGGIYNNGTLNLSGDNLILDNMKGSGVSVKTSNVYLPEGKVINITEHLTTASEIGITTAKAPSTGTPVPLTAGFSAKCSGMEPATIFTSDEEYALITGEGEVKLAISNGSITENFPLSQTDLQLSISLSASSENQVPATSFTIGEENYIYVTAKLGTGEAAPVIAPAQITYSFQLKCGSEFVSELPGTTQDNNTVKITIPQTISYPDTQTILFPDKYTLYVVAEYKNINHDARFFIEGVSPVSLP
ncbi:MAG: hypothetical protein K5930_03965 [Treponemataceae bacterium]|nr:hypothetical protein [Treponemataceae bacterium]